MKRNFAIMLCICFSSVHLFGQTEKVIFTKLWTLQDCIGYAKTHNIQLQTLQKNTELSEQDLLEAKAAVLPNLSASVSQNLTHSTVKSSASENLQDQPSIASDYSVGSQMVLYQGGYIKNQITSRKTSVKQNQLSVAQAFNDISLQITQSYLSILLAKENVITNRDILETSKTQYEQGKIFYNSGKISKKDLLQLESSVATDQYNFVVAQNQVRQQILVLKQLLQLPSSTYFDVRQLALSDIPGPVKPLEEAKAIALQIRPEVENASLSVKQADLQLKQAYASAKPSVIAGASLASGYADNQNSKYFTQIDRSFYQRLGIAITFPFYSNRINKTNIQKARILIDQANLTSQNTKMVLQQQVELAYINLENAKSQYDASIEQLNATEETYRIASEQLKIGALDVVGFLVQKNLYIQAQHQNIQAKYTAILTKGIYAFYTGEPFSFE